MGSPPELAVPRLSASTVAAPGGVRAHDAHKRALSARRPAPEPPTTRPPRTPGRHRSAYAASLPALTDEYTIDELFVHEQTGRAPDEALAPGAGPPSTVVQ